MHMAIVQQLLDVIRLKGGDEERSVEPAILKGRGGTRDVVVDQDDGRACRE
jgi:hypothetical protein